MVGNQLQINRKILESDRNKIQDIGEISKEEIIATINDEYWRQWRKLLISSEFPIIKCNKLGYFQLKFTKAKAEIYKLIKKMRWNREHFPEKQPGDGTMIGQMQKHHMTVFRILWAQIDKMRHQHIKRVKKINEKYRKRGQECKIRWNYE